MGDVSLTHAYFSPGFIIIILFHDCKFKYLVHIPCTQGIAKVNVSICYNYTLCTQLHKLKATIKKWYREVFILRMLGKSERCMIVQELVV